MVPAWTSGSIQKYSIFCVSQTSSRRSLEPCKAKNLPHWPLEQKMTAQTVEQQHWEGKSWWESFFRWFREFRGSEKVMSESWQTMKSQALAYPMEILYKQIRNGLKWFCGNSKNQSKICSNWENSQSRKTCTKNSRKLCGLSACPCSTLSPVGLEQNGPILSSLPPGGRK